jgi:hypothetical protein
MQITTDDYEIYFDPGQPEILHIVESKTGNTIDITPDEAITWLQLMLKNRTELRAMRSGEI